MRNRILAGLITTLLAVSAQAVQQVPTGQAQFAAHVPLAQQQKQQLPMAAAAAPVPLPAAKQMQDMDFEDLTAADQKAPEQESFEMDFAKQAAPAVAKAAPAEFAAKAKQGSRSASAKSHAGSAKHSSRDFSKGQHAGSRSARQVAGQPVPQVQAQHAERVEAARQVREVQRQMGMGFNNFGTMQTNNTDRVIYDNEFVFGLSPYIRTDAPRNTTKPPVIG